VNPQQEAYEAKVEEAFDACTSKLNELIDTEDTDRFDAGDVPWAEHSKSKRYNQAMDQVAQSFGFPDYDHLEDEAARLGLFDDPDHNSNE
jgi:hypothetical protein